MAMENKQPMSDQSKPVPSIPEILQMMAAIKMEMDLSHQDWDERLNELSDALAILLKQHELEEQKKELGDKWGE